MRMLMCDDEALGFEPGRNSPRISPPDFSVTKSARTFTAADAEQAAAQINRRRRKSGRTTRPRTTQYTDLKTSCCDRRRFRLYCRLAGSINTPRGSFRLYPPLRLQFRNVGRFCCTSVETISNMKYNVLTLK